MPPPLHSDQEYLFTTCKKYNIDLEVFRKTCAQNNLPLTVLRKTCVRPQFAFMVFERLFKRLFRTSSVYQNSIIVQNTC